LTGSQHILRRQKLHTKNLK